MKIAFHKTNVAYLQNNNNSASEEKEIYKMQSEKNVKNTDFMEKLDLVKDKHKLKYSDLMYIKQAEEAAIQRASIYRKRRNNCAIAGFALAGLSLGIYLYTIYAVRQETFLNDLNEPEIVIEKKINRA
ncbi:hypothetical protein E2986_02694 [Frieseomelitta varia]|uniref:Cytochrome c oxidase assembly factor 3 n=2 Tax=Frieseomelitta varia TaxID=561572 RepID=A0A833RUZ8_9HYME|nr:hypothetical protein E2986_02694 [Frieseomelitta varia]